GLGFERERGVRYLRQLLVYQHPHSNRSTGGPRPLSRGKGLCCGRQHPCIWFFEQCQRGVQALIHGKHRLGERDFLSQGLAGSKRGPPPFYAWACCSCWRTPSAPIFPSGISAESFGGNAK